MKSVDGEQRWLSPLLSSMSQKRVKKVTKKPSVFPITEGLFSSLFSLLKEFLHIRHHAALYAFGRYQVLEYDLFGKYLVTKVT
ncbi:MULTISPECIES: hypothetical protein [Butyricimonas]|uniref:hypothetical protein n=1 Tax=Butyricimonas TaxID=574697 RepID=UPI002A80FCA8|nr:hypothetical protein [Butyricimonas paravirosa]